MGWTSRPSSCVASVARTSLVFMFEEVPEPVWNTSIGKCSSCLPLITSSTACTMASATSCSMTPSSAFARAAARFTCASARIWPDSNGVPLIGKFSTARWVWARYRADAGTRTSPMVSCSIRNLGASSVILLCCLIAQPPSRGARGTWLRGSWHLAEGSWQPSERANTSGIFVRKRALGPRLTWNTGPTGLVVFGGGGLGWGGRSDVPLGLGGLGLVASAFRAGCLIHIGQVYPGVLGNDCLIRLFIIGFLIRIDDRAREVY